MVRPPQRCPGGPVRGQPSAYLCNPSVSLTLIGQHAAVDNDSSCQPEGKPLLGREGNERLCLVVSCLPVPAALMELSSEAAGKSQTMGVRQLLGQGKRLLISLQGLV